MAQFFAYVYPEKTGYRVFVEGIADVHAETLAEAERKARAVVERAVFASHPNRDAQPYSSAAALFELELKVVRVRARRERARSRRLGLSPTKDSSGGTR